jgi:uncharacterized membrane protein YeaQ/YmgE (transglycosylase-associated protein family)
VLHGAPPARIAQMALAVAGLVPVLAMVRYAAKGATESFWVSFVGAVVLYLVWAKLNADANHLT